MSSTKVTNALYGKATSRLRAAHQEEFLRLLEEEYAKANLVYKRRRTPEERAAQEAAAKKAAAQRKVAALVTQFGEDVLPVKL